MPDDIKPDDCKTIGSYLLYKLDRTLAILGVVAIAMLALYLSKTPETMNLATAAIGGLVGYIGGRSGN